MASENGYEAALDIISVRQVLMLEFWCISASFHPPSGVGILIPALEIKIAVRGGGQLPRISGQDKNNPQEQLAPFLHFGIHPQSSDLLFGFPSRPTIPGKQSSLFWGQVVANLFQALGVEALEARNMGPIPVLSTAHCVAPSKSSTESPLLPDARYPRELSSSMEMFYFCIVHYRGL